MIDRYIIKNGHRLRYGYTTGSCAAAAARAAAEKLFFNRDLAVVTISTPRGWDVDIEIHEITGTGGYARCHVIKDAGDDPDCTDGMRIYASAKKSRECGVHVTGGEGIGIAGKKGLQVKAGAYAINPVPMKMIADEVAKALPEGSGVIIEISAPQGVELAKKTFNPKLGIEGGISILGTTGIVEPISTEAIKESLELKLSIIKEAGNDTAVLVPGNYGKKFARESLHIPEDLIAEAGNYIGYMIEKAEYYGLKNLLLVGHIGKLIKVAGGIFDTHSRSTDARLEILSANYVYKTGNAGMAKKILECSTTEEALEFIDDNAVYEMIAEKTAKRCREYSRSAVLVETVLFSMEKGLLAMTQGAGEMLARMGSLL